LQGLRERERERERGEWAFPAADDAPHGLNCTGTSELISGGPSVPSAERGRWGENRVERL
jgi:hypothetical protein